MVSKTELMGLGMPVPLANVMGVFPAVVSAVGASSGSATQIGVSHDCKYLGWY